MATKIKVNNKTITIVGDNNVTVNGNKIYVNGKKIDFPDEKNINISIEGNLENLAVDYCESIKINGDTTKINTKSGGNPQPLKAKELYGNACDNGDQKGGDNYKYLNLKKY